MGKISVPLLDRIDMHLEVSAIPFEKLMQKRHGESSLLIRERVIRARALQTKRFASISGLKCVTSGMRIYQ